MDDRAWTKSTRALIDQLRDEEKSQRSASSHPPERDARGMLQRIVEGDHYAVLGVPRDASTEEIKSAYFEQVAFYHPDRKTAEQLGVDADQQRKIIIALTTAYDTLKRRRTRVPYDEYLNDRTDTIGARTSVSPATREADVEMESTVYSVIKPRPADEAQQNSTVPPPARRRGLPRLQPEGSVRPTKPPAKTVADKPMTIPPQSRVTGVPIGRIGTNRFREMMDGAIAEEQWASAVNLARLALESEPNDQGLKKKIEELQYKADRQLADKFVAQGKYEEETRNYARASRSYERAANGKASAELYGRAARCLLAAGSDDRKAVELARKAMLLEQESAEFRVLLARAYGKAGMFQSAMGEARRALVYEPGNADARQLVKELKANF